MKIYTHTGDDGSTGLIGGQRVGKDTLVIEACGCVDELNSAVGLATGACGHERMLAVLQGVQHRLFEVGAGLMTPTPGSKTGGAEQKANATQGPCLEAEQVVALEHEIDRIVPQLAELHHFVLPGGCELAARLHVARTACRLAERRCVALSRQQPLSEPVLAYLNRLSDLLFVMARWANQLEGVPDIVWTGQAGFSSSSA